MAATLGLSTLLYPPYAGFCYAGPVRSLLDGFTGFRIDKVEPVDHGQTEETA